MVSASDLDVVPDRCRSCSPSSRTPRLGPSRLSSSRRSHPSSWYRRKRTKLLLTLLALLASFFFVNWFMLLRLPHQHDAPHPVPKPRLRSSVSLPLHGKWNKVGNRKKSQKGNYVRMLALAAHALAENKREPKDLWQEPFVPASAWRPCADQRNWEPNEGKNGYILITANGGINQQRVAVCNAVVVARLLNSTLVIPRFMYSSVWRDVSQFSDIYQEQHFINYLTPDIRIVRELPKDLQSLDLEAIGSVTDVDMGKEAKPSFYLKHILPIILKNQVVHFVGFGNRLAFDPIPFELQRLRCRCNFHALQFVPRIQETGALLLKRLREHSDFIGPLDHYLTGPFAESIKEKSGNNTKKASKYLALHLRFEIDMVSHSLCEFGGGEEERKELEAYREIHFPALVLLKKTTKLPSPSELRSEGLCPLTPEEAILMLAALGFNRKTHIFVAGSNLYGGRSRLVALTSLYPKLVTKENLLSPAELEPFANYSSQLAALDFIGCTASDAFAMTDSGSQLSSLVSGYRIYYGGGKMPTIRPNKRRLASIFMKNSTIEWRVFEQRVRKAVRQTKHVQTRPKARSVYRYPRCKACMCRTD
ncbi:O-fucosyltransferase 15-like isoform X2 [Abrus precatorius]|uniref:O-fucosyltransferase family protein n=1 Tax=Abrus precatorius TaxID=3816 RepID=A0A8B8JHT6_ABRPR|nr:O-fucosyltransferase 15-like isoform X2 [Abrus precatorius]